MAESTLHWKFKFKWSGSEGVKFRRELLLFSRESRNTPQAGAPTALPLLPALPSRRAARFLAVAFLGRIYGQQMIRVFSRHYRPLLYVIISLAVTAGIGALVYFKWYRPTRQRVVGKARQSQRR